VLQDMSVERVGGQTARQVDTRVIAATNRSLSALVQSGHFRPDLYYRLAGVEVHVPPLRARREDVPLLVDHFLTRYRRAHDLTVSTPALEAMMAYDWPGNVRQLGRVLERLIALSGGPMILLNELPAEISKEYEEVISDVERHTISLRAWSSRYVRLVLERCQGNKRRACHALDISYHTLQSYLDFEVAAPPATSSAPGMPPAPSLELASTSS
jgi:transcriptional regulator with PAS, ATPase and Fis domain